MPYKSSPKEVELKKVLENFRSQLKIIELQTVKKITEILAKNDEHKISQTLKDIKKIKK